MGPEVSTVIKLLPYIDKGLSILLVVLLVYLIKYATGKFKEINHCTSSMKKNINLLDKNQAVMDLKIDNQEKEIERNEKDLDDLEKRFNTIKST